MTKKTLFTIVIASTCMLHASCESKDKTEPVINPIEASRYVELPDTPFKLLLPQSSVIKKNIVYSQPPDLIDERDDFFGFRYSQGTFSSFQEFVNNSCAHVPVQQIVHTTEAINDGIQYGEVDCGFGEAKRFLFFNGEAVSFINSGDETSFGMRLYENSIRSARLR